MGPVAQRLWSLWGSIEEMAEDLGESINDLRRRKGLGQIPDERHDQAIVIHARAMGRRITRADLARVRSVRPEIELAERKALIGAFYEKAGGREEVHKRTGVSLVHLRTNKSRGFLNRTARHEYRLLAQEIGFELPEELFNRPPG